MPRKRIRPRVEATTKKQRKAEEADATTAEAKAQIETELAATRAKTARLRALRQAQGAAESDEKSADSKAS